MIDKLQVQHHIDQIEMHQNALKEILLNAFILDEERDDYESEIRNLGKQIEDFEDDLEERDELRMKVAAASADLEEITSLDEATEMIDRINAVIKKLEE
jgi:hypothetical protein